jgi:hypothetical protein
MLEEKIIGLTGFISEFITDYWKQEIVTAYEGTINHKLICVFQDILIEQMKSEINDIEKIKILKDLIEYSPGYFSESEKNPGLMKPAAPLEKIFIVSHNHLFVQLSVAQKIKNRKVNYLKKDLDTLHSFSGKEPEKYYTDEKRIRDQQEKSETMKGIHELKKKTGENLDFHFLPCNRTMSFILLISRLSKN